MPSRAFYRLFVGPVLTTWDFQSHAERGRELLLPHTPRRLRLHRGVSLYDSLDAAFARLRQIEPEHRGIAVLVFEESAPFAIEQYGRDRSHHTVWATAEALMERVHWLLTAEQVRSDLP